VPQLSRFFIRAGFICLVLGMAAGLVAAISPTLAVVRPTWIHLITVGWLTQLIFGVGLWLFPPVRTGQPDSGKGGWTGFWLLNGGLLLRVIGEPLVAFTGKGELLLLASALLQLLAIVVLVITLAPRVRAR
jgi:hypothetical protein